MGLVLRDTLTTNESLAFLHRWKNQRPIFNSIGVLTANRFLRKALTGSRIEFVVAHLRFLGRLPKEHVLADLNGIPGLEFLGSVGLLLVLGRSPELLRAQLNHVVATRHFILYLLKLK